jgi:hypothetical protein
MVLEVAVVELNTILQGEIRIEEFLERDEQRRGE